MSRRGLQRALLAAVVLLSCSVMARAAEGASNPADQPIGTAFKWIHFVILAGLTYWVFAKLLPPVFRRNADNIDAAIAKATAARVVAEKQLQNAAAKLANLEKEIAEFRALAQREASAEIARLRLITKGDVEKIGTAAKTEIEAAERAARVELKALAAKLAVDGAESLVAEQMTPSVQEALISQFVQSLQGRPN